MTASDILTILSIFSLVAAGLQWYIKIKIKPISDTVCEIRNETKTNGGTSMRDEIKAIKNAGGMVIRVVRGPEPEWYDAAVSVNRGPNGNSTWSLSGEKLKRLQVHPSEYSWVGSKFDTVIENSGTLDALFEQVESFLKPKSQEQDLPASNQVLQPQ